MRELDRDELISFLYRKVGRWDSIWWNGELITLGEALGRANELPPSNRALCSRDEVLLPGALAPARSEAGSGSRFYDGGEHDPL